ncbi:hypothetical protein [Paraburkholderia guartelaensis]|uniref:hypothetical protein n=1 Tax=Paraburkholderia guartelaensis TaxID=2546446 RepID=UPI002AB66807|nr:hypothetical protein [Paraburkholderia guartelaensis]
MTILKRVSRELSVYAQRISIHGDRLINLQRGLHFHIHSFDASPFLGHQDIRSAALSFLSGAEGVSHTEYSVTSAQLASTHFDLASDAFGRGCFLV